MKDTTLVLGSEDTQIDENVSRIFVGGCLGLLGAVVDGIVSNVFMVIVGVIRLQDGQFGVSVASYALLVALPCLIIGIIITTLDRGNRRPLMWIIVEALGLGLATLSSGINLPFIAFVLGGATAASAMVWLKWRFMSAREQPILSDTARLFVGGATVILIAGIMYVQLAILSSILSQIVD